MSGFHVTESVSDRKKSRELAEARQSGAAAPEVDVKTGNMINPHNPEFITKRPWYLGSSEVSGPSLDHQGDQRLEKDRLELSLTAADALLRDERKKRKKWKVGMWVESLRGNKGPYQICQIRKIAKNGSEFDLQYDDDGFVEKNVKFPKKLRGTEHARIRLTGTGTRSLQINHSKYGKETYDSKRDSYHGYDVSTNSYMEQLQSKFEKRERLRRQLKEEQLQVQLQLQQDKESKGKKGDMSDDEDQDGNGEEEEDQDDEFGNADDKVFTSRLARQGGVGGAQMKMTARNLRIREDTAKYLRNLDLNSSYYDPKSRSMRQDPNPEHHDEADADDYRGDNYARMSGDAIQFAKTQVFAWDTNPTAVNANVQSDQQNVTDINNMNMNMNMHVQANPSQTELLRKQRDTQSTSQKHQQRQAVLQKYGGEHYLDTATSSQQQQRSKVVRFGVKFVEQHYKRDGTTANDSSSQNNNKTQQQMHAQQQHQPLTCKYEEDVFPNGHTAVWGSYFHPAAFRWGFADDHSLLRNSYSTGPNGKIANDEANQLRYGAPNAKSTSNSNNDPSTSSIASGAAQLAQARQMLQSIQNQTNNNNSAKNDNDHDDRKRTYNDVTKEENEEALRIQRPRTHDPMLQHS